MSGTPEHPEAKPLPPPNEPRVLVIVIPVRQIDPRAEPTGAAYEGTRDALNALDACVVEPETKVERPLAEQGKETDRAKDLAKELEPEIDQSLGDLAKEWCDESLAWLEKTKKLAGAAAQRAMQAGAREWEKRRHEAELGLIKAHNTIQAYWAKYCPTHEEIVKDLLKWTIRGVILYVAYQAVGLPWS